jgi:hypothetical protein
MNFAPKPLAAARLAEARRQLKQVDLKIEAAVEHRRQTLLDGPATSAAAVSADRMVADLRFLKARLLDQIEWLPERVSQEESEAAWPPTAALAREKLDQMRERLGRLRSIKRFDRSAVHDAEIDSLIPGCGAMAKHVEFLTNFEANSRGEVA